MSDYEWEITQTLLNGKQALRHRDNHEDLKIFGKNGFIRSYGQGYRALFDNPLAHNLVNDRLGLAKPRSRKGDEAYIEFSQKDFDLVHKAIKVPRTQTSQRQLAKRFSSLI